MTLTTGRRGMFTGSAAAALAASLPLPALGQAKPVKIGEDESFRIGLRVLIDSIEKMNPSAQWRHSFRRQIVHLLCRSKKLKRVGWNRIDLERANESRKPGDWASRKTREHAIRTSAMNKLFDHWRPAYDGE